MAISSRIIAELMDVPNTGLTEELPEWRTDWGNPDCFFCDAKAQHSENACEDHASIAGRDEYHPGQERAGEHSRQRKIRFYEAYQMLCDTGQTRKEALIAVAKIESVSTDTVRTNVRIGKGLLENERANSL